MMSLARQKISPVVISTALGQAGRGIFPYTLLPGYRRLLRVVRETGATVLTKSATRFPRRGNFIPAQSPHLEIPPPAAGDGHAQRLRPHQPGGGGLLPGYPALLRGRNQRRPQPLPRIHQRDGDRHPGDPGGPGDLSGEPGSALLGPGTQLLLPQLPGGDRPKPPAGL